MKKLLDQLGFVPFTGTLWKHNRHQYIIDVPKECTTEDIEALIFNAGVSHTQEKLKVLIGIKERA